MFSRVFTFLKQFKIEENAAIFLALLRSVDKLHRVNVKGKKIHNENGKHRLHLF